MKKIVFLKILIVVGLSMVLVSLLSGFTFADDNIVDVNTNNSSNSMFPDVFSNSDFENGTTVENVSEINSTNNVVNSNTDNNVLNEIETNYILNGVDESNENNENINELAYTGIEDCSGIVALIAVIGITVSIYSYVKMKEYNI